VIAIRRIHGSDSSWAMPRLEPAKQQEIGDSTGDLRGLDPG
jgi:hypothetical protein